MTFETFNLHPQVLTGVQAQGYRTPTPIQAQAIPPIMHGQDVMGLAQTGTGKTAAFALPILHYLTQHPRGRVRALVVAPTRELAEQIHQHFGLLGRHTRLRSVTVYGGASMYRQKQALRSGCEIVVACPGRLLDLVEQRAVDLSHVDMLVLDEADQMFDMGFLPDIRRILSHLPTERQTLLFSATMPEAIRQLATDILHNPVTVKASTLAPVATVSHALYPVAPDNKTKMLLHILAETDTDSVLVFTRTKHRAEKVGRELHEAGYAVATLQGNMSQPRRQEAMEGFRRGRYQILVATDIAARGIDVSSISHVINYDMPDTVEAYTHRIGRTGRAAKTGDALTLVTREDDYLVRLIERTLGYALERHMVQGLSAVLPVNAPRGPQSKKPARSQPPTRPQAPRPPARHEAARPEGARHEAPRPAMHAEPARPETKAPTKPTKPGKPARRGQRGRGFTKQGPALAGGNQSGARTVRAQ